ncbi:MAG: carbonic anhydrase [Planctomycetota bacterium]
MMGLQHRRTIAVVAPLAGLAVIFGLIVLPNSSTAEESSKSKVEVLTADQALTQLEEGNRRCVEGKSAHGHDLAKWRERFLVKQNPFATVLGCSDSRVAPELLFDQGFGELFVIRVAGNIVDPDVVGSIQYAVEHLDNKLIVVLGHQNCGAVTAALSPPDQTQDEPPELGKLLNRIRPAIVQVDRNQEREQLITAAVEANVRASVEQLRQVPSIAATVKSKNVKVLGAVYYIDSGEITFLDE